MGRLHRVSSGSRSGGGPIAELQDITAMPSSGSTRQPFLTDIRKCGEELAELILIICFNRPIPRLAFEHAFNIMNIMDILHFWKKSHIFYLGSISHISKVWWSCVDDGCRATLPDFSYNELGAGRPSKGFWLVKEPILNSWLLIQLPRVLWSCDGPRKPDCMQVPEQSVGVCEHACSAVHHKGCAPDCWKLSTVKGLGRRRQWACTTWTWRAEAQW